MKNFFSFLAAAVIVVGAGALMGWKRAPDTIANAIAKKLQVPVEIGEINGDINNIFINKIKIGNPDNSVLPQALTCKKMVFHAGASEYQEKDVVIQEIDLDTVYFDLEFDRPKGKKGNWDTIMDNSLDAKEELEKESEGNGDPPDLIRTVLIRNLVLTNVTTDLVYRNKKDVKRLPAIDRIVLKDLKSEGKDSVMSQVLKLVIGESIKAVIEQQDIKQGLPGGRLKYVLPLRHLRSGQSLNLRVIPIVTNRENNRPIAITGPSTAA